MKKFISLLLTFMVVLSMITAIPFAANAATSNLDPNRVYVQVGDEYFEVKKGDIFEYVFTLEYPDAKIGSLDLRIPYDTDGLDFVPTLDEYGDDDMDAMFPVLGDSVIYNFKRDGEILFNYSHIRGKSFNSSNNVVFKGNFKVTADKGVYAINGYLYTLADKDVNSIVFKGETIIEHTCAQDIPKLTPVDPNTEPPTGESSEEIETEEITDIPSSDIPTDPSTEPDEEETDDVSETPTDPSVQPSEIETEEPSETIEPTEPPTGESSEEIETEEITDIPSSEIPSEDIEDVSFYFINSCKWTTVCAFGIIDTENTDVLWPGVQMEYVFTSTENHDVYLVTISAKYVIFNDPITESQTRMIEIQPDMFYDCESGMWIDSVEPVKPTEEKTEAPTIAPTTRPDESITVYLINSKDWTYQNIYLWNDVDSIAAWPGLAMIYTGQTASNGAPIFKFTCKKYYANVIFNSGVGGEQTADLMLENGKYYDNLTDQWYDTPDMVEIPIDPPTIPSETPTDPPATDDEPEIEPTEEESTEIIEPTEAPSSEAPSEDESTEPSEEPTEKPTEQIKVYLIDKAGWGGGHVYAWNENGEQHNPWPGSTMTFEGAFGDYDVFSYTFDEAYDYIIFNNGAEGDQTDNLDFVINGVFNNKRMEWDVVPDDPSENPSEDPIEPSEKPSEDPNPSEGEEEKLMGDINGDGKITVFDATLLQRFIAKMDELTEEQLSICDMDNDGQIKVFDATILQRIVAKQD